MTLLRNTLLIFFLLSSICYGRAVLPIQSAPDSTPIAHPKASPTQTLETIAKRHELLPLLFNGYRELSRTVFNGPQKKLWAQVVWVGVSASFSF